MTTPRVLGVMQALAMLGTVGAGASMLAPAESAAQSIPVLQCPAAPPGSGSSCAGFAPGRECSFYGDSTRCTCTASTERETRPNPPAWRCISRSVPGPLAPPELAA